MVMERRKRDDVTIFFHNIISNVVIRLSKLFILRGDAREKITSLVDINKNLYVCASPVTGQRFNLIN